MLLFYLALWLAVFSALRLCALCKWPEMMGTIKSKTSSENLTRFDTNEKIMIGRVFPMYLENVEYSVIYIGDLAVISRSGNRRA